VKIDEKYLKKLLKDIEYFSPMNDFGLGLKDGETTLIKKLLRRLKRKSK